MASRRRQPSRAQQKATLEELVRKQFSAEHPYGVGDFERYKPCTFHGE